MRRMSRLVVSFIALMGLAGCTSLQGEIFKEEFWVDSPLNDVENNLAELGIAALAQGNYVTAESYLQGALKANPIDVDALIGLGILYHNTGQSVRARQMYEAVIALRPDESHQFVIWNNLTTRPISEIASVNLALMQSGKTSTTMNGAGAPGTGTGGYTVDAASGLPISGSGAPTIGVAPSQPMANQAYNTSVMSEPAMPMASNSGSGAIGSFGSGDGNLTSRFSTIRALRDQGLMTDQEYRTRRQANIGGLLPLTSPPPAEGLDRPVPTTEQISDRLRAIGRALEMRAITISQHASERSMILEALMPSAPVVVARPALPPRGLMQAADQVRRLEKLRDSGYISSDEYAKERRAIEQAMLPEKPAATPQDMNFASSANGAPKSLTVSGPQPGVHLASYRSKVQADRGWSQIKRAHKSLIEGMDPYVVRVDLGKKGVYFRLKGGPLASADEAKSLCRKLKRRRQFCEPTLVGEE